MKVITKQFVFIAQKASGSMNNYELARDMRSAWEKLQNIIERENIVTINKHIGYVIRPSWSQITDNRFDLWIGVEVDKVYENSEEIDCLVIPSRSYACITCKGDIEQIQASYEYLLEWMEKEECLMDHSLGAYSIEPNRIYPVNPFEQTSVPIEQFDFDILCPIK
ncbi:GyrI-like domain-containing protein [Bacillus alkalicellulosilyticus]|uniref:GyrI-like domain-containing protein n=1 Tax=Alkalihalobacterium alkalicellulosilyticum TaxID=1912214 RepID=UPI001FE47DE2|nr:GyrI-like domain-containing protein [Bacillus alkalicellulosilyticus]